MSTCHQKVQSQRAHSCCEGCDRPSCQAVAQGPLLESALLPWHPQQPPAAPLHSPALAVGCAPAPPEHIKHPTYGFVSTKVQTYVFHI